jgi:hypothetical protein
MEYARRKKKWLDEVFSVPSGFAVEHLLEQQREQFNQLLRYLAPRDRLFVRLYERGVQDLASYAAVLDISQLPSSDQRATVKRTWDRIRRKLRRLRQSIFLLEPYRTGKPLSFGPRLRGG